jgi:acyl carrier protein
MQKDLKNEVKDFIIKTFMKGKGQIGDSQSLFEENILDSFGMLELMSFIEKNFGVSFGPSEVTIKNFDSVNVIVQLIERKRK